MAYGNWGALVFKDGERMKNWEDQTPYREKEQEGGYYQVFGKCRDLGQLDPHHAVLGDMGMRLCGYKSEPCLFHKGEAVSLEPFCKRHPGQSPCDDAEWEGEMDGYRFSARQYDGNMVDLELTQPDGSVWKSTCGYGYGAGHMD